MSHHASHTIVEWSGSPISGRGPPGPGTARQPLTPFSGRTLPAYNTMSQEVLLEVLLDIGTQDSRCNEESIVA